MSEQGEILMNPSFETAGAGGADVLAWWVEDLGTSADGVVAQDNTAASDGTYSAKLTAPTTGVTSISQSTAIAPSTSLTLSFDSLGDGTNALRYVVYDVTNSAVIINTTSTNNVSALWVSYSTAVSIPATCYRVRVTFFSPAAGSGGSAWVDNVSMRETYAQMPVVRRFGDTWATAEVLPIGAASLPHGAGRGVSSLVMLPGGGSYDWGRTDVTPDPAPRSLMIKGQWKAASDAAMIAKAAKLNALLGVRSKLWRDHGAGVHTQWHWARCVEVGGDLAHDQRLANAEYQLVFELDAGPWCGADYTRTLTLTTTSETVWCPNWGNAPVRNIKITIDPGGANITNLGVTHWVEENGALVGGLTDWDYTGAIAVGSTLEVDAGAATVEVGPSGSMVSGYANLVLSSNHKIGEWLYFRPGYNALVIARTGGTNTATIKLEYAEGWY